MGKLKVGIIGTGWIADVMANTLREMDEAKAYAVASRTQTKADEFAKSHGIKHSYGSYEALLQDPKVDLIYIGTPHHLHKEHAKLCIDYGKPVLVEKPFCVNAKEAKEVLDYAKEKGVFIAEAIWPRYIPMTGMIQEILDSGIIGKPQMLTANLGYPNIGVERMHDPKLAGGALLDLGVYTINFADIFFGDEIEKISASAVMTDQGVDAQDSITLIYKDGRMAVLNSSMTSKSDRMGCIHGTEGFLIVENVNNYQSVEVYNFDYERILKKKCPKQITGYEYEILACKQALKDGLKTCQEMEPSKIIRIMEMMDEVRRQIHLVYPFESEKES